MHSLLYLDVFKAYHFSAFSFKFFFLAGLLLFPVIIIVSDRCSVNFCQFIITHAAGKLIFTLSELLVNMYKICESEFPNCGHPGKKMAVLQD